MHVNDVLRHYTADLLAVLRHCHTAVVRHAEDDQLKRIANAGPVLRDVDIVLNRQITALDKHLEDLGGGGAVGAMKETATSVSGFLTGVYGKIRGEKASRMLRDDHAALSFICTCATMLHATALAVGGPATANLIQAFIREYPRLIMAVGDLVPYAVIADLGADGVPIHNSQGGVEAVRALQNAWRSSSRNDPLS